MDNLIRMWSTRWADTFRYLPIWAWVTIFLIGVAIGYSVAGNW